MHLMYTLDAQGNRVSHASHFDASEIPVTLPNRLEAAGLPWRYFTEAGSNVVSDVAEAFRSLEEEKAALLAFLES